MLRSLSISTAILLVILYLPITSHAIDEKYYIKGDLGISVPTDKMKRQSGYLVDKRVDISPQYSLGVGYHATKQLRLDIAFSHMGDFKYDGTIITKGGQTIVQKQNTKVDTFMLNTYYHFLEDTKPSLLFSPFVGVGIGLAKIKHNNSSITSLDNSTAKILMERRPSTNLAFNMIAGLSAVVIDNFAVEWSYKYAYLGNSNGVNKSKVYIANQVSDVSLDTKKYKFSTHNVSIGIRYNF